MNNKSYYQLDDYIEFYGNVEQVKKMMNHCSHCGAKLLQSHMPDYRHHVIQETLRCLDCGEGTTQKHYFIN
jgi:hypothetical protein